MKIIFLLCTMLVLCTNLYAKDLSQEFDRNYQDRIELTKSEIMQFKEFDFYLVPGILSESFIQNDRRSWLDFTILTKEYLSAQKKYLKKLGLNVKRLPTSSFSVSESKAILRQVLDETSSKKRKAFFITHSLGGLALLEELVLNGGTEVVAGIIFIQSPFYGAPVADAFLKYPFHIDKWLLPILPFFNTSEETLRYLSVAERVKFMQTHEKDIDDLIAKIPLITVSGIANSHRSLFKPSIDLIAYGCVKSFTEKCLTPILYDGALDKSDGMVPLESSKLNKADSVVLDGVDHGETVVNIPFENYSKKRTIQALLKLFFRNNKSRSTPVSHVGPGPLKENE